MRLPLALTCFVPTECVCLDGARRCPHCNKEVKQQFARHLRTHQPENRYRCLVPGCDKSYTRKYDLEDHMKAHPQQQPPSPHPSQPVSQPYPPVPSAPKVAAESPAPSYPPPYTISMPPRVLRRSASEEAATLACPWPGCGRFFAHASTLKQHVQGHQLSAHDAPVPSPPQSPAPPEYDLGHGHDLLCPPGCQLCAALVSPLSPYRVAPAEPPSFGEDWNDWNDWRGH